MEQKHCARCEAEKPATDFYPNDRTCKDCRKARVRANRAANIDHYRAYDQRRFQENPAIAARHSAYQKTDAGKASIKKSREKWLVENNDKRAAHIILGNAVRRGDVVKPGTCSKCGSPPYGGKGLHGHHHDYTKPLDVVWLCPKCHVEVHKSC